MVHAHIEPTGLIASQRSIKQPVARQLSAPACPEPLDWGTLSNQNPVAAIMGPLGPPTCRQSIPSWKPTS